MEQPWWFASAAGLAGVVVGVVLKWLIDSLQERSKRWYNVRQTLLSQRKKLYEDFRVKAEQIHTAQGSLDTLVSDHSANARVAAWSPDGDRDAAVEVLKASQYGRKMMYRGLSDLCNIAADFAVSAAPRDVTDAAIEVVRVFEERADHLSLLCELGAKEPEPSSPSDQFGTKLVEFQAAAIADTG